MRKIISFFICALVSFNLFIFRANAATMQDFKYIITYTTFTQNEPLVVYANSSQWDYRDPYWVLATPDFHQGYCNTWANVNGKWYYIDSAGHLVQNKMFTDYNDKKYYLTSDGSMLTNDYCYEPFNVLIFYAGSDGVLGKIGTYN